MNEPAPKELCEKLQAMGCLQESGLWWPSKQFASGDISPTRLIPTMPDAWYLEGGWIRAFFQNDFTGATEQAIKNSRIFCKDGFLDSYEGCPVCDATEPDRGAIPRYISLRHEIVDYSDGPWWQMLERTMRK